MSTIADYAGRTYDLAAFRGQRPVGPALAAQDLIGDDGGAICTGIVKLAQWFVVELLTALGSVPYDPTRGTRLVPLLRQGRLRSEADVFIAFGFAAGDVQARAAQVEDPAAPADERFADAVLTRVAIGPGSVSLSVALHSLAGTSRPLILPIPTVA